MNLEQLNQPPLLTIHCDGRITVDDRLKPEETAKLVLDQVKTQWMNDIQCTKIRELNDHIKRLEEAVQTAWEIISNVSGGNWHNQSPEWRDAVTRWCCNDFLPSIPEAKEEKP